MTTDQHTDQAAIRALFERANKAWAAGDAATYASVFAPDADYVAWFGMHVKGRAAIEASHAALFARFKSHLDGEITGLRFVTPDVAIVHGRGAMIRGRGRRNRFNTKVNLYVAVRRDGEWSFAAFHNTKYKWLINTLFGKRDPGVQMSGIANMA